MPPFRAERFKITPKSPEEIAAEEALVAQSVEVWRRADGILPFNGRTKRGQATTSEKAIYQDREQSGTNTYTRAWLQRSGTDPDAPIRILTDIAIVAEGGVVQQVTPDDGQHRLSLYEAGLGGVFPNLNVEQKLELVGAASDTIDTIEDATLAATLRKA